MSYEARGIGDAGCSLTSVDREVRGDGEGYTAVALRELYSTYIKISRAGAPVTFSCGRLRDAKSPHVLCVVRTRW